MTRYESTGTWFDPAEAAKRAYPRWAGTLIDAARVPVGTVLAIDPGDPTCVGVWFGGVKSPGVCEIKTLRTWEKPKPMTNQTKVTVNPRGLLGPFQCPPHEVKVTTPAGATINAEEAAKAYDTCQANKVYDSKGWERAREVSVECDKLRGERDEACEQSARGWKAAEDNAKVGMGYRTERDEARAELARLKGYYRGALPFPVRSCTLPLGTLDHLRYVLARELPLALSSEVRSERVDGVPLGTIKIVIQEGTGKPAPAVTKDTVVTLGMLRDLAARLTDSDLQATIDRVINPAPAAPTPSRYR